MTVTWYSLSRNVTIAFFVGLLSLGMQSSEGDVLHIDLAWQAPVDLDLFLTGPDGETIYFGNRDARAGYKMQDESNCKAVSSSNAPYHESAIITAAKVGRYRVSVDYILNCGSGITEVGALVTLYDAVTGLKLGSKDIIVKRQELKTVAWEFEVGEK